MIFALFLIMIFMGLMAFMQFGQQPVDEQTPAQNYAQNMAIWHQAAMLEAANAPACNPVSVPCAKPLNGRIWSGSAPINSLASNWPGYLPMVRIDAQSGWQSFLLTGQDGGGEGSYVLTVFRGFGMTNNPLPIQGSDQMSGTNFSKGITRTITDRVGLGILNCAPSASPPACSFSRAAAQGNPGSSSTTADTALRFPLSNFTSQNIALSSFFDEVTSVSSVGAALNGKPAMMTRVAD